MKVVALGDFLAQGTERAWPVALSAETTVVCGFLGGLPELFTLLKNPEVFALHQRWGSVSEGRAPTETMNDYNPSEPSL